MSPGRAAIVLAQLLRLDPRAAGWLRTGDALRQLELFPGRWLAPCASTTTEAPSPPDSVSAPVGSRARPRPRQLSLPREPRRNHRWQQDRCLRCGALRFLAYDSKQLADAADTLPAVSRPRLVVYRYVLDGKDLSRRRPECR